MNILRVFKKAKNAGMSMQSRLYAFLFAFVAAMIIVFAIVLTATGGLSGGMREAESFVHKEFAAKLSNLSSKCGEIETQLGILSQTLSQNMERELSQRQIHPRNLQDHPEVLSDIIENELSVMQLALERTDCSGVFIVLDATVNPALPGSEHSRAGLYIRYSEPRIPGSAYMTWEILRGVSQTAYQNKLTVPRDWDMEFDVKDRAFFHQPMEAGAGSSLPLSKLDYWSAESVIADLNEPMLVCSLPLLDSDGNPFGVCGLEMSAWNFETSLTPTDSDYPGVACVFGELIQNKLSLMNALIAGRRVGAGAWGSQSTISIASDGDLSRYEMESGRSYLGLHEEVRLFSDDSPYEARSYALAMLIPEDIIDKTSFNERLLLIAILAALILLGVLGAVYIGRKFLSPIMSALEAIRSGNLSDIKTGIVEIDSVIERMREHNKNEPLPADIFSGFIVRVRTLTPVEKRVFRLYLEGLDDAAILKKLYISKSDLSALGERIYAKLGLSDKRTLMLYIELIKMGGYENRIV